MKFDQIVPPLKLVTTFFIILGFNGIVLLQLEQNLATHCSLKGQICGDLCLRINDTCECGGNTFDTNDEKYCCTPINEKCSIKDDHHISCENGQMISTFGEFCDGCPLATFSEIALKSNCSKSSNHFCPLYGSSLKICMDKVNVSISDYCSIENAWNCPNAKDGLNFEQCYESFYGRDTDKLKCISRIDKNDKNLFKEKDIRRRWNLFTQITVENNKLQCAEETYPLTELCHDATPSQPCTLKDTNEVVDINFDAIEFRFDLCHDYSLWRGDTGKCVPKEPEDFENQRNYISTPLCNRTEFNCSNTPWEIFKEYCPNKDDSCDGYDQTKHFFCNESKTCIPKKKTCDGIFHCLYGEDEMFGLCKDTFPKEATIECIEKRGPGTIDIKIMATPCDGIVECRDGSDENCGEDRWILLITTTLLLLATICIYLHIVFIRLPNWKNSVFRDFDVATICSESQPSNFKEMKGNALAKLKNDTSQEQCAEALDKEGFFSKIKQGISKNFLGPTIQRNFDLLSIILPQMDFLKDMILVVKLITLLGGLVVFTNPQLFSSNVIFLLLGTIFIPQYLGTLSYAISNPPDRNDVPQIVITILLIVFSPMFSYVLHFKNLFIDLKLRLLPYDQTYIKAKENLKRILNRHIKLELGLETLYQLAIGLILLLLSYTQTPVQKGLKAVFNEGLSTLTLFALSATNVLSAISFTSSHCKALNVCREHFPFTSRLAASLYSLCGLITRVVAMLMYFTVPLGLFSLLRHWQAEQVPWSQYTLDFVTPQGLLFLGDNEPIVWNEVDRWLKNGTLFFVDYELKRILPNPDYFIQAPDVTLYIGLNWLPYLFIFFGHVVIHTIVIFAAKCKLSQVFKCCFNLLDKVIHSLENTNLPINCQEWDDGEGDAEEHRRRMRLNWKETLVTIIINAVFNFTLLIPLCYLVFKMQERHDVLKRTIGYLDEEQKALDKGYFLLIVSSITIVVGSLLQILFFYMYNGPFHPFVNILVDENEETSNAEQSNALKDKSKEFIGIPSTCDQSKQTMNIIDLK